MATPLSKLSAELQALYGKIFPGKVGYDLFCYVRDVILDSAPFKAKVKEIIDEIVEEQIGEINTEMLERIETLEAKMAEITKGNTVDPVIDPTTAAGTGAGTPLAADPRKKRGGSHKRTTTDKIDEVQNPAQAGSAKENLRALAEFMES